MSRDPFHTQNAHLLSLQGIENFRDVGGLPNGRWSLRKVG